MLRFWLKTFAIFALMMGGLEVASRLALGHSPRMRFDPAFDRLPAPHQPVVQASEGWSRARTNALGHLDAEMPAELPADGILVIGDSFTEARHVAQAARFTNLLGTALGRRVYNVGHTGWSPINALGFLRAEVPRFKPSTVVVQVSGNDLKDIFARRRPHLVAQPDGGFAIDVPRRKAGLGTVRSMLARSALAGEVVTAALVAVSGDPDDDENAKVGGGPDQCPVPAASPAAMAWLFTSMRAAHPDVRLLYLPKLDYHGGCVDRCAGAAALIHATAASTGLPVIDPTAAICTTFEATRQPLNGFWNTVPGTGHFNAAGHRVIAASLTAAFR